MFNPDYIPKPFHTVLACWAVSVPMVHFGVLPRLEAWLIISILILGVIAILGQHFLPYVDVSFVDLSLQANGLS